MRKSVSIAFNLFSTPRKGRLKGELPEFLQSSRRTTIQVKGKTVQCYLWNEQATDKPLVLLVHGWESNASRWQQLVEYLDTSKYRFVAFDAFAMGRSEGKRFNVPNFSFLIHELLNCFQPTRVVSHSLGAFALLASLAKHSYPFLERVLLLGCPNRFKDVLVNYSAMMGYRYQLREELFAYAQSLIDVPLDNYASQCFIDRYNIPTLLIHDKQDDVVLLQECTLFHQRLIEHKHQIVLTAGYGHSLQDAEVYQAIECFIQ